MIIAFRLRRTNCLKDLFAKIPKIFLVSKLSKRRGLVKKPKILFVLSMHTKHCNISPTCLLLTEQLQYLGNFLHCWDVYEGAVDDVGVQHEGHVVHRALAAGPGVAAQHLVLAEHLNTPVSRRV